MSDEDRETKPFKFVTGELLQRFSARRFSSGLISKNNEY